MAKLKKFVEQLSFSRFAAIAIGLDIVLSSINLLVDVIYAEGFTLEVGSIAHHLRL